MSLHHLQQAVAKMQGIKLAQSADANPGRLEANEKSIGGTNHVNRAASETVGMDGSPKGYRWSQELPPDQPSTSGRTPGLETLTESAEAGALDENLTMLKRLFTNDGADRAADQELIAKSFVHGKPGQYVTRSKTLLEKVGSVLGR